MSKRLSQNEAEKVIEGLLHIDQFIKWDTKSGCYEGVASRFVAICKAGHQFSQTFTKQVHQGKGCRQCGINNRAKSRLIPAEEAIRRIINRGVVKEFIRWETESGKYEGRDSKFTAICSKGHCFTQSFHSHVSGGRNCPHCSGRYKPTTEEAQERILSNGVVKKVIGWSTKSGKYENQKNLFTGICRNGHVFTQMFENHVRLNCGCPICYGNQRLTQKQAEQNILVRGKVKRIICWETDSSTYENAHSHFRAECINGHVFKQSYNHHVYSGYGCSQCAGNIKFTTEEAEKRLYDLGRIKKIIRWETGSSEYESNQSKFFAICPNNHTFIQSFQAHVSGHGCVKCRNEKIAGTKRATLQEVENTLMKIGRIKKLEGWDTNSGTYENRHSKFIAICPNGHHFTQSYANHIKGSSCPECATSGFDPSKPAFFYLQRLSNSSIGPFLKVGVTNRTAKDRMKQQSKLSKFKHELIFSIYFENGQKAISLEQTILEKCESGVVEPEDLPDGFSETIAYDDKEKLIKLISSTGKIVDHNSME